MGYRVVSSYKFCGQRGVDPKTKLEMLDNLPQSGLVIVIVDIQRNLG